MHIHVDMYHLHLLNLHNLYNVCNSISVTAYLKTFKGLLKLRASMILKNKFCSIEPLLTIFWSIGPILSFHPRNPFFICPFGSPLRMYCIDPQALVFIFNGAHEDSAANNEMYLHHCFLKPWEYLCHTSLKNWRFV